MERDSIFWSLREGLRLPSFKAKPNSNTIWTRSLTFWFIALCFGVLFALFLDAKIIILLRQLPEHIKDMAEVLTDIGNSNWILFIFGMILIITSIYPMKGPSLRQKVKIYTWRTMAFMGFIAVAGSGLITILFKILLGRSRPASFDYLGAYHFDFFMLDAIGQSFPSGHATTMGAIAMLLILWFPKGKILWLGLAVIIALMRVILAQHYLSDIVLGFNLGLIFTLLMARFYAQKGVVFCIPHQALMPCVKRHYYPFKHYVR